MDKTEEKIDMKYTNQRVEILSYLRTHHGHPTVDEVYEGVREKLTRISKATVYKNLKFLANKGMIEEVNVKGITRFESNLIPHHHVLCTECGKIDDFESDKLFDYTLEIAKNIDGFKLDAINTNFYGTCKNCMEKK